MPPSGAPFPRVADLRKVAVPRFARDDGEVTVLQAGAQVPFEIMRSFTVKAPAGAKRGMHAHRRCQQFLTCPAGAIEVHCDDGTAQKSFLLNESDQGLLVPAAIWASETFREPNSVLLVLCDRPYEEDDYIRDYRAFQEFRRAAGSSAGR